MSSDYDCRYMEMSSLTYIAGFSAKFLFQAIYHSFSEKQPKCKLCVSKYEMVQNIQCLCKAKLQYLVFNNFEKSRLLCRVYSSILINISSQYFR